MPKLVYQVTEALQGAHTHSHKHTYTCVCALTDSPWLGANVELGQIFEANIAKLN